VDYPKSVPSVGLVGGKFVDENQATGVVGSLIPSQWGNAVTDELLAVIRAAGIAPNEANNGQLLAALQDMLRKSAGRLLRTSVYTLIGGVQMVSVNGSAFTAVGAGSCTSLADTKAIDYEVMAGGAAGAGCAAAGNNQISVAGGGSGGTYARGYLPTNAAFVLAVSVGAGGIGVAAAPGQPGGSSSLGSLVTCPGGTSSATGSTLAPGTTPFIAGGTPQPPAPSGSFLFAVRGGQGEYGAFFSSGGFFSGPGGGSFYGPGAPPVSFYANGSPAVNHGAGGSGSLTTANNGASIGGNGREGIITIREYA